MRASKIIPLISIIVLCFFFAGCASMLSPSSATLSKVDSVGDKSVEIEEDINVFTNKISSEIEEIEKIDYASFYVDSTKDESIEADQVFEDVLSSKKYDASPFNTLGFNITEEDAIIYVKSSASTGDYENAFKVLSYLGYKIGEGGIENTKKYSIALNCIRKGDYAKAYGLLSKQLDCLDSQELIEEMIEKKLVNFEVGGIGPSGGYIFYDKGSYSDGWRYLEAAPKDIGEAVFGYYRYRANGDNLCVNGSVNYYKENCTRKEIGYGKSNTEMLVEAMGSEAYVDSSGLGKTEKYAAKMCEDYSISGFDDWFLPSKDELNLIYNNLYLKSIGTFSGYYYWSSSEYSGNYAWGRGFKGGGNDYYYRSNKRYVRPVRAF